MFCNTTTVRSSRFSHYRHCYSKLSALAREKRVGVELPVIDHQELVKFKYQPHAKHDRQRSANMRPFRIQVKAEEVPKVESRKLSHVSRIELHERNKSRSSSRFSSRFSSKRPSFCKKDFVDTSSQKY